jgi:hypothetical protein
MVLRSASAIEDVLCHCRQDESLAPLYFFFDGRDEQSALQLHESLIRSLTFQLSCRRAVVPYALSSLYETCQSTNTSPTMKSLHRTLLAILNDFQHVYVMIDALDECRERERLLGWIVETISCSGDKLHLLVTSRSERNIAQHLHSPKIVEVVVERDAVDYDIRLYIDSKLREDEALGRWGAGACSKIKSALVQGAKGMYGYDQFYVDMHTHVCVRFRWVDLQLVELQECYHLEAVESQLKCLPKGLDESYHQILSRISKGKHFQDVKKILQWLAFSARTLWLEEVAEVVCLAFDLNQEPYFAPSCRFANPQSVLYICSSLVSYSKGKCHLRIIVSSY